MDHEPGGVRGTEAEVEPAGFLLESPVESLEVIQVEGKDQTGHEPGGGVTRREALVLGAAAVGGAAIAGIRPAAAQQGVESQEDKRLREAQARDIVRELETRTPTGLLAKLNEIAKSKVTTDEGVWSINGTQEPLKSWLKDKKFNKVFTQGPDKPEKAELNIIINKDQGKFTMTMIAKDLGYFGLTTVSTIIKDIPITINP